MSEPPPPAPPPSPSRPVPQVLVIEQSAGAILLMTEALTDLVPETVVATETEPHRLLVGMGSGAGSAPPDASILSLTWRDLGAPEVLAIIGALAARSSAPLIALASDHRAAYLAECRSAGVTRTHPRPGTWLGYRSLAMAVFELANISLPPWPAAMAPGQGATPASRRSRSLHRR